jgi:hypothetical protein
MIENLIRCTICNQVIPNYEGYELIQSKSLPGVDWSDADLISAKDFLHTHSGHPLEKLSVEADSCISEKPSYDPIRVIYFYAHNAERRFLVRRIKAALDEPASYEIVPGRLMVSNVSLKIQENDIRKQITAEKRFSPLMKERMERFIQVFRGEIKRISPEKIEEVIEEVYEDEGGTVAYGGLKNSYWERIMNRCRLYFDKSELKALERFIEENRNPPDVLALLIERRISIISLVADKASVVLQDKDETGEAIEIQSSAIAEMRAAKKPQ